MWPRTRVKFRSGAGAKDWQFRKADYIFLRRQRWQCIFEGIETRDAGFFEASSTTHQHPRDVLAG